MTAHISGSVGRMLGLVGPDRGAGNPRFPHSKNFRPCGHALPTGCNQCGLRDQEGQQNRDFGFALIHAASVFFPAEAL
jgi:hypothetical protein